MSVTTPYTVTFETNLGCSVSSVIRQVIAALRSTGETLQDKFVPGDLSAHRLVTLKSSHQLVLTPCLASRQTGTASCIEVIFRHSSMQRQHSRRQCYGCTLPHHASSGSLHALPAALVPAVAFRSAGQLPAAAALIPSAATGPAGTPDTSAVLEAVTCRDTHTKGLNRLMINQL